MRGEVRCLCKKHGGLQVSQASDLHTWAEWLPLFQKEKIAEIQEGRWQQFPDSSPRDSFLANNEPRIVHVSILGPLQLLNMSYWQQLHISYHSKEPEQCFSIPAQHLECMGLQELINHSIIQLICSKREIPFIPLYTQIPKSSSRLLDNTCTLTTKNAAFPEMRHSNHLKVSSHPT